MTDQAESIQLLKKDLINPKRSPETSAQYAAVLMRLHRRLRSQQPVHRVDLWGRVDTLLPILRQYMHSSRKYYVAVLLVALRKWPQARTKWLPSFYQLTERVERKQNGQRTRRERRNWVTPAELQQKISLLERQVGAMHSANDVPRRRLLFQHLALRFVTDIPSLRTQNLVAKLVTPRTDNGKDNVLAQQGEAFTLIMRKFKTASSFGEQRVQLPAKLCRVVSRSLTLFPRKYLFSHLADPRRGMSPNLISQFFGKIFDDKRVTPSLLRKVTVSAFMRSRPTLEQRVALSQRMLHSVQVQRAFYDKRK